MKRSPQRKAATRRTASASARLQDRSRKQRRNFFLERLEDRSLLATMIWQGGSGQNMSTAANWIGGVAPQQDDNLVFPISANKSITNDFAAGTRFRSITISDGAGGGYNISGNSITLLEGVTFNASGGSATVSVPLTLGASASIFSTTFGAKLTLSGELELGNQQTLTTDGKGDIDVTGVIKGTGGSGITKLGDGTLTLGGPNTSANTFDGVVNVNQGSILVTKDSGLGSTAGGTIVGTGASVQVSGGRTIAENFVIRDVGVGFNLDTMGAIRSVGGANTLTGTITLGNNSSFGADLGSTLTIGAPTLGGTIAAAPGSSDFGFTKFGAGTLVLGGSIDSPVTGQVTVLQGTMELGKTGGALPFQGNLVVGDNRNTQTNPNATVRLTAANQIPETNFFKTGVNSVTVNSNGRLDLNGQNDTVGTLNMVTGRSASAQVTTGTGILTMLGDIAVSSTADSSGASPAARISGNLNLGSFFSGAGGVATRTINVGDTATPNIAADLVVETSRPISSSTRSSTAPQASRSPRPAAARCGWRERTPTPGQRGSMRAS
jgi:autotransporter-associated beta strand protein